MLLLLLRLLCCLGSPVIRNNVAKELSLQTSLLERLMESHPLYQKKQHNGSAVGEGSDDSHASSCI